MLTLIYDPNSKNQSNNIIVVQLWYCKHGWILTLLNIIK